MAKGGTIKWRRAAFSELRRTPEMTARLQREVDRILEEVDGGRAGDYRGGVDPGSQIGAGKGRARGYVVTNSVPAMKREARSNYLLRALGNGGGA